MLVPCGKQCFPPLCVEYKLPLQCLGCKNVCLCECVRKEFTWCQHEKKGAPIQAAKILPRNLSGIVMFRQLHCDKIHSFHSATSFLLVTIVSLMPN